MYDTTTAHIGTLFGSISDSDQPTLSLELSCHEELLLLVEKCSDEMGKNVYATKMMFNLLIFINWFLNV